MNTTTTTNAAELLASFRRQVSAKTYDNPDDAVFFKQSPWIESDAVRLRVLIERAIIRKSVQGFIDAGLLVGVHDGCDFILDRTCYISAVMEAVMGTDTDTLHIYATYGEVRRVGHVLLIYGNDGYDVISDHSTSLDERLTEVSAFADEIMEALRA